MDDIQRAHKEYYDGFAKQFKIQEPDERDEDERFNDFAAKLSGKKVLDIGCGTGRFVPLFVDEGLEYTGMDISTGMIDVAQEHFPDQRFVESDILDEATWPQETFDGFWAAASLQHIPREQWDLAFDNIEKHMNPGAVGFIGVTRERRPQQLEVEPRHFTFMTTDEMKTFVENRNWTFHKAYDLPDSYYYTWGGYLVSLP